MKRRMGGSLNELREVGRAGHDKVQRVQRTLAPFFLALPHPCSTIE